MGVFKHLHLLGVLCWVRLRQHGFSRYSDQIVTRAIRGATVKPTMANFETKMKAQAVTALAQAAPTAPMLGTPHPVTGVYDPMHPWGVHWPGHAEHPTRDSPKFHSKDFLESFDTWKNFNLGGGEVATTMYYTAQAVISSKLPGGKH